jgi:hypothetical protein
MLAGTSRYRYKSKLCIRINTYINQFVKAEVRVTEV